MDNYYLVLVEQKDKEGKNVVSSWRTKQDANDVGNMLLKNGSITKYRIYFSEDVSDYFKLKELKF